MNDKVEDKDIKKAFFNKDGEISVSTSTFLRFMTILGGEIILYLISRKYKMFHLCFSILTPKYLEKVSKLRYKRSLYFALKKLPAYKKLHEETGDIQPITDKANYIDAYPIEERCINGVLPTKNITIDESSGSTGMPYNWFRNVVF